MSALALRLLRGFSCGLWLPCVVRAGAGDFPFDHELILDTARMPGSKRIPSLEIGQNGAASIDLWCASLRGQANVSDDMISIVPGPAQPAQCAPDRQAGDENLWRRSRR